MNKEKQIEEMAELERLLRIRRMDIEKQGCDIWALIKKTESEEQSIADYLIGQGYRKADEVAREIFEDCHNTLIKILGAVRDGLDKAIREDNEEAKLVHIGTEETVKCIILVFFELKKKYTESEKNNGKAE